MQLDRRLQRSLRPLEALVFFLDAARVRLGLRALTLGTPDGWLIAGAGDDLAAVADLGARFDASSGDQDGEVATWRTRVGGAEVVITSAGRSMSEDLADGVRRILAA